MILVNIFLIHYLECFVKKRFKMIILQLLIILFYNKLSSKLHEGDIMKKIKVSAAALINNKKVLITQRQDSNYKGLWEFPGGKIEINESNFDTVVRELKEELQIEVLPIKHFYTAEYDYPNFHLTMEMIHCSLISGEITLTEHSAFKWVGIDELDDVNWVPADVSVIEPLKKLLI